MLRLNKPPVHIMPFHDTLIIDGPEDKVAQVASELSEFFKNEWKIINRKPIPVDIDIEALNAWPGEVKQDGRDKEIQSVVRNRGGNLI